MEREELMRRLELESDVFRNPTVKDAFTEVDRKDFVHEDYDFEAYEDYSIPTVDGESIMQPTIMAFMLELLDAQKGDTVLDIGSGTGWSSALLGSMVGVDGKVYGLEIIPELVEVSKKNLKKYPHLPVEIFQADSEMGMAAHAPYERIISTTAFDSEDAGPVELLSLLVSGGTMVVPIGDTIVKFEKISETEVEQKEYPGFSFSSYRSYETQ